MTPLPAGFEALAPFVKDWALANAVDRDARRTAATAPEREAFYQAAFPLLPAALTHLDQTPLGQFNAADERLMQLMLGLAHIATAIEAQGSDEPKHAQARQHMKIIRAMSDAP
jgi:hypothetical protein